MGVAAHSVLREVLIWGRGCLVRIGWVSGFGCFSFVGVSEMEGRWRVGKREIIIYIV